MTLQTLIRFTYLWCFDQATHKNLERELKITSRHTIVDWKNFHRDVCAQHFDRNAIIIGGPGKIVEIDETLVTRRKYNVGRSLPQQWVFGGIERGSNNCFVLAVPDRSGETLLPLIQKHIALGESYKFLLS